MISNESYWKQLASRRELDLRKTKYRYMDQKCTPDIIYVLANSIVNLDPSKKIFTRQDLQTSSAFSTQMTLFFTKPDPNNKNVQNEVDKIISQPLKTLTYAGILSESRQGRQNVYEISDSDALKRLASHESKCYEFLVHFNLAVLESSGQLELFESYRNGSHTPEEFKNLKDRFFLFFKANSNLGQKGSSGLTEFGRIFPKILNPIATHWGIPGSVKGRVSQYPYVYQELNYNRPNSRDLSKRKNVSRSEAALAESKKKKYFETESTKAKRSVLEYQSRTSEVRDDLAAGAATHAHHIFPVSRFPELQAVRENIIALTASQHNQRAHPNNNTQLVDPEYQRICILAKLGSISGSEAANDSFYSREMMVHCLKEGWGLQLLTDASFDTIRLAVRNYSLV